MSERPTPAASSRSAAAGCSRWFARHDYDTLSMAVTAREAGISKAVLHHYFPSRQAHFTPTLEQSGRRARRPRCEDVLRLGLRALEGALGEPL